MVVVVVVVKVKKREHSLGSPVHLCYREEQVAEAGTGGGKITFTRNTKLFMEGTPEKQKKKRQKITKHTREVNT